MSDRRPAMNGGVPVCSLEHCEQYDGKRCRAMGFRPDRLCEPEIEAMAVAISTHGTELARSRAALAEMQAERDAARAEVAAMRPVIDAAKAWLGSPGIDRGCKGERDHCPICRLMDAVADMEFGDADRLFGGRP